MRAAECVGLLVSPSSLTSHLSPSHQYIDQGVGAEDRGSSVDVLRGQGQGAVGGGDHHRLQGLQGEVRIDDQGRAYVIIMWDTDHGQRDPA